MKLSELMQRLPSFFVRCYQSYAVNIYKMVKFEKSEIIIENGVSISVSRSRQAETEDYELGETCKGVVSGSEYKKTVYVPGTSKTFKGLKKGQVYYVKVCPYAVYDNGTRVFGKNSQIKKVRIKKKIDKQPSLKRAQDSIICFTKWRLFYKFYKFSCGIGKVGRDGVWDFYVQHIFNKYPIPLCRIQNKYMRYCPNDINRIKRACCLYTQMAGFFSCFRLVRRLYLKVQLFMDDDGEIRQRRDDTLPAEVTQGFLDGMKL